MILVAITFISGILAVVDAFLDEECVEWLVGKKKDIDLIGKFKYIGTVLFLVFGVLSLIFGGEYTNKYKKLRNQQETVSEQYLLSNKTADDWAWVCTEMNAINEKMKELDESREQTKFWDFTAYWASDDYETYSAIITETTISFNAERHLIPLRYENTDTE